MRRHLAELAVLITVAATLFGAASYARESIDESCKQAYMAGFTDGQHSANTNARIMAEGKVAR